MLNVDFNDKTQLYQFIAGVSAVTVILLGCLVILTPFFPAILLATIFTLATWPAFSWLNKKLGGRTAVAALLMTLFLAGCFIVPLVIIGTSSAENFMKVYETFRTGLTGNTAGIGEHLGGIPYIGDMLQTWWNDVTADRDSMMALLQDYAGTTSETLIKLGGSIGRGLMDLTLGVLIAYFFFRHGTRAAVRVSNLIDTFGGARGQHLLAVTKETLIGVVYGMLGTSLAQGALAAFGFWAAGVPGATFLGLVTFFVAFTPIGPPLIWIPATVWLYTQGHIYAALFLGVWGTLVISTIDNLLRPYFISLRGNLPFLLVLLGVIGGVVAFGFIGLFIGPTLLALAYTLVLEWSTNGLDAGKRKNGKSKKKKEASA